MEFVHPSDGPYIMTQGKKWLDFSSCDFLGLAQHPEVKKGAIKYALKYGVGIPVPPLLSAPQEQLESKLAHFLGKEAARLFPSLQELLQILKNQKITSYIDDSTTIGIEGDNGFGSASHTPDLVVGSLALGVGCSGAYLAGSKKIVAACNPSEPLAYPLLGALDSAFSFIPEMDTERKTVEKHMAWLEKQLKDFSFKILKSPRAVLEFKSEKEAEQIRRFFAEELIYLAPPSGKTLYIAMTALHTPDDLDQLAVALKKLSTTDLALATQSATPTP